MDAKSFINLTENIWRPDQLLFRCGSASCITISPTGRSEGRWDCITSGLRREAGYRAIVAQKPDIVLAAGPESSLKGALAAADGLPVVMIAVDYDPLAKGYVQSLSRPSKSITGVYFQNVELVGKRLGLLKQAFPNAATMTVFWDKASADHWAALQVVAPRFGVQLNGIEFAERPYDYERAIANAAARAIFSTRADRHSSSSTVRASPNRHQAPHGHGLRTTRTGRRGRPDFVWAVPHGNVCACREVRRSHRERCKARRPASKQPNKFRVVVNLKTANCRISVVIRPVGETSSSMMEESIRAREFLIRHRQPVFRAVAGKIRGLLSQQRQLSAADHQRQRLEHAARLHHRRVALRHRLIQPVA